MLDLQSSLLEAQNALVHQATHDPVTGIFNRRAILDVLEKELARVLRENGTLTIGMCDIDHFKKINDTYGHQAGGDVLVAFAQVIKGCLRQYGRVGRYGGEEFLVVAPGDKGEIADSLYERLRVSIANAEMKTSAGLVSITVSIGAARGRGQRTADTLLAAAGTSLYQAKADG